MLLKVNPSSADPRRVSTALVAQAQNPSWILGWVYLGRVAVGAALAISAPAGPSGTSLVALLVLLAIFTAGSYAFTHVRRRQPTGPFLYFQVLFDVLLLSAAVYLTGGQRSIFVPLFILVISAGALLLPTLLGGILIGFLASASYFAAAVGAAGTTEPGVVLLAVLFAIVALVTNYLGDRLRQTGAALGEVQTQLRLLRLDTNDIIDTIGTGILTVDGEGRLAYLNPAAGELLSLSPTVWIDQPILDELDRIAPGLGDVIHRTAANRTPVRRFETRPLADDAFILGVSTTLLERSGEDRPPVTAIFQDITERKRVESLRRRAERLEAVAELSASLAHEIKNPLASIRSAVEQIASSGVEPEDARFLGALIVRESDRLSRLLGEFIDFARVKVTAPEPVDFIELVNGVVDVVRTHPDTREHSSEISFQAPETPVFIRGAEDLLHRAVFNLTLNAVQWAGKGGRIDLSLDEVRSDLLSPALGAFRLVRLAVHDNGPGVSEEIREQIFDPFFTRRSGGTGLGLALVQRAVEAHGGAIFVDNAPNGEAGAVFSLYLPSLSIDLPARGASDPSSQAGAP